MGTKLLLEPERPCISLFISGDVRLVASQQSGPIVAALPRGDTGPTVRQPDAAARGQPGLPDVLPELRAERVL